MFACTNPTDEKDNIGSQVRVTNLNDAIQILETAYHAGKVIKSAETVTESQMQGWKIMFSDMSSILFLSNKENAIISSVIQNPPMRTISLLLVNDITFVFPMDMVCPTGITLLTNRLLLGKDIVKTFEFQINPSNATIDLDVEKNDSQLSLSFRSTYEPNESFPVVNYKLLKVEPSVDEDGVMILGQYKAYVQDLGIAEGYDEEVVVEVSSKDEVGNPSRFFSEAINISWGKGGLFQSFAIGDISVSKINENSIAVRLPYNTDASALKASFTTDGSKVYIGDIEQISGETINDFSSPVTYRVNSLNGEEHIYVITVCYSDLPVVYLNTKDNAEIVSKDDWMKKSLMVVGNTNGIYDLEYENVNIKGRGNSTWGFPKKPYAIKLDKKAEVLGMPKHKRWCLLANWADRTLMRNAVAFEVARNTESLEWTPKGKFVEVILNGKFLGNYYLCEQIKIDENRVNIAEMESSDVGDVSITGGYLLELDTYYDEVNKFRSVYGFDSKGTVGMPVNIKEPDEDVLMPLQLEYIKNYFCTVESLLYATDFPVNKSYKDYIDVNTFVDWWFVYELTQNEEPNHPKSSYMYKDRNGKLKAGPVWDFDFSFFSLRSSKFHIKDAIWYNRLFLDPDFVMLVRQKWQRSKSRFEAVADFIDQQSAFIKSSAVANGIQWPITIQGTGDEHLSFDDAVARLKSIYLQRIMWMDEAIKSDNLYNRIRE